MWTKRTEPLLEAVYEAHRVVAGHIEKQPGLTKRERYMVLLAAAMVANQCALFEAMEEKPLIRQ